MDPFGIWATLWATVIASALAWRAHRKGSLTPAGCVAAFGVGFGLVWTGARGMNLLVFYQVSMIATKYQHAIKLQLDGSLQQPPSSSSSGKPKKSGSIRGVRQVLACSLLATILSLIHGLAFGSEQRIQFHRNEDPAPGQWWWSPSHLACAVLAHHATCLADTLASELGILSSAAPVLVTQPWKTVPPGTNGGISFLGLVWSALGGFLIGLSTLFWDYVSGIPSSDALPLLLFATTCGLLGSWIDSLLGATIQASYYDADQKMVYQEKGKNAHTRVMIEGTGKNWLNNEQVNMVSVAITTLVGGWILGPMCLSSS